MGPMFGSRHRLEISAGKILGLGLFLCLSLNLASSVGVAWAHGGGAPQLSNAEAGPYWVSVWTQPDPLQVGEAHITVAVSEPGVSTAGYREAGSPVLDAVVQVRYESLDRDGEGLVAAATHEGAANKLFYEADLELPSTGRWKATISVEGPEGPGSTGFEAQVSAPKAFNWVYVVGLGLAGLVIVGVVQRFRDQRNRV